jgi:hypothetical protein
MNGSFFTAEINWSITRSLAAYGQFVMNELAILNETAPGKHEAPNGLGFMGGLQYSHSFDTWASLFFIECIYTYPYLYMNASPYASFIFMHNVEFVHAGQYYYYFGYPRDTLALTAGTRFFNGDKLIINGTFSWISRGKHGGHPIEWDWERTEDAFKERTPSGTPENNFIVSVGAEYKVFKYFTLKGNLTGIFITNNNNQKGSNETGLQAAVSVNFKY